PKVLVEAGTVRSLAKRIDSGVDEPTRLAWINASGSRIPCAYAHAGAGGLFTLRSFASAFGSEQPICGIQAFTDREASSNRLDSVKTTAQGCLAALRTDQPQGPYLLAGHSIGGH